MPDILLRLEAEHIAIHRPWASWIDLAKSAMQVIEVNRMAAKSKDLPASESKPANMEFTAVKITQLALPDTKKSNLEKAATIKTPTTKQGSNSASKPYAVTKKSVATISKKVGKKTSGTKQPLPINKVAISKKAEDTNSLTKKVSRKNK
jgi:hypothetical protein